MGLRQRLAGARDAVGARLRTLSVERAETMAELGRADPATLRAWWGLHEAVRTTLGDEILTGWTQLVTVAARRDVHAGRALATQLPDLLAHMDPTDRARALRILHDVVRVQPAAASEVAAALGSLLRALPDEGSFRAFLAHGLALHLRNPDAARSYLRRETAQGQRDAAHAGPGLSLEAVTRTMALYARAHCGEDVEIRAGKGQTFSDGHHIYLPERIEHFGDDDDANFRVYRILTARAAGYLEFGTFDLDLSLLKGPAAWPDRREAETDLGRFFRAFTNASIARELFHILEDARIDTALRRAYPGIARDLDALAAVLHVEPPVPPARARVPRVLATLERHARGTVVTDIELDDEETEVIAALVGAITSARTLACDAVEQTAKSPRGGVEAIAELVLAHVPALERLLTTSTPGGAALPDTRGKHRDVRTNDRAVSTGMDVHTGVGARIRPEAAGAPERAVEDDARRILEELRAEGSPADLGEARRTARARARGKDGEADTARIAEDPRLRRGALIERSTHEESGAAQVMRGRAADPDVEDGVAVFTYPEWDGALQDLRPRWTTVREVRLREGDRAFVDDVLQRERVLIQRLRRQFQALRPDALQRQRLQSDGDELDLDRAVDEAVDRRARHASETRAYVRHHRARRDVAVAFLVDASSSTNESADGSGKRILDVEKAALVVVAEALSALGDPFAVWAYSGYGRAEVDFYVAKAFHEPWDDRAARRIGRITFKRENRDGAAIRHATRRLLCQPARARLLIHLSDGKPLDCGCDHYFDRHAQDDTRAALREARAAGIHPFCVTVDPTGPSYLARMYGDVAYTVIDRVDQLPERLVRIVRRLTT